MTLLILRTRTTPSSDNEEHLEQAMGLLQNGKAEYDRSSLDEAVQDDIEPVARWTTTRSRLLRLAKVLLLFLLPSFVAERIQPETTKPPKTVHKTAWLDGLRGVAALSVAIFHFTNAIYNNTAAAWGVKDEYSVMKLPFIRLVYAGPFAVSLFFVISGFALSIKPVELMLNRNPDKGRLFTTLSSAAFRRPLRLYIPAWASALLVFMVLTSGVMEFMGFKEIAKSVKAHPPSLVRRDQSGETILEPTGGKASPIHELSAIENIERLFLVWLRGCLHMLFVFDNTKPAEKQGHPFNSPLWSIVVEFKASMLLYLVHLAVSLLRQRVRILTTVLLMFFSVYAGAWDMVLFLGGFGIAQLEHILPVFEDHIRDEPKYRRFWFGFLTVNLVLGLYLASYPDYYASQAPGYSWLAWMVPDSYGNEKARFWQGIGGLQIVFALSRMPSLAAVFASRPLRYIGRISFSLYLVHSMVLVTWGVTILYYMWKLTGRDSPLMNAVGFVLSVIILLPSIMWVADIFARVVDAPSVEFARWVESKCIG